MSYLQEAVSTLSELIASESDMADDQIESVRKLLDRIDKVILRALDNRMELVDEIGEIKEMIGREIVNEDREDAVISRATELAEDSSLDPGFARDIYRLILDRAVERQKAIQE